MSFLPLPLSVSLIECGPVHTAFYEKLEGGPGGALERADAQTRHLFAHYLRVYEQALNEAQDPEEVTEVGVNGVWGAVSGWGVVMLPQGCPADTCCSSCFSSF